MDAEETIELKIGNRPLRVPICGDEVTTRRIVREVNDRLKQIENEGGRVDTLSFALRVAVSFASDLHRARAEQAQDNKELLVALHEIVESLRGLCGAADDTGE